MNRDYEILYNNNFEDIKNTVESYIHFFQNKYYVSMLRYLYNNKYNNYDCLDESNILLFIEENKLPLYKFWTAKKICDYYSENIKWTSDTDSNEYLTTVRKKELSYIRNIIQYIELLSMDIELLSIQIERIPVIDSTEYTYSNNKYDNIISTHFDVTFTNDDISGNKENKSNYDKAKYNILEKLLTEILNKMNISNENSNNLNLFDSYPKLFYDTEIDAYGLIDTDQDYIFDYQPNKYDVIEMPDIIQFDKNNIPFDYYRNTIIFLKNKHVFTSYIDKYISQSTDTLRQDYEYILNNIKDYIKYIPIERFFNGKITTNRWYKLLIKQGDVKRMLFENNNHYQLISDNTISNENFIYYNNSIDDIKKALIIWYLYNFNNNDINNLYINNILNDKKIFNDEYHSEIKNVIKNISFIFDKLHIDIEKDISNTLLDLNIYNLTDYNIHLENIKFMLNDQYLYFTFTNMESINMWYIPSIKLFYNYKYNYNTESDEGTTERILIEQSVELIDLNNLIKVLDSKTNNNWKIGNYKVTFSINLDDIFNIINNYITDKLIENDILFNENYFSILFEIEKECRGYYSKKFEDIIKFTIKKSANSINIEFYKKITDIENYNNLKNIQKYNSGKWKNIYDNIFTQQENEDILQKMNNNDKREEIIKTMNAFITNHNYNSNKIKIETKQEILLHNIKKLYDKYDHLLKIKNEIQSKTTTPSSITTTPSSITTTPSSITSTPSTTCPVLILLN